MDYFIGYKFEGDIQEWHNSVAKDVSERFDTKKVHELIPPHITLYYPFSLEDMALVHDILKRTVEENDTLGSFVIEGFDRFDWNVVYAKVQADEQAHEIQTLIKDGLDALGADEDDPYPWHPHATVANRASEETIKQVWGYVQTLPTPRFEFSFDNITLFKYVGDKKWEVDTVFKKT